MKNLFILLFVLIVLICVCYFSLKRNKGELATHYNITKPTLSKWVKFFSCGISPKEWKSMRKLTNWEIASIKNVWGEDPTKVLSKSQIADQASASPKVLAKYVKENLEKIGITEEAWESLNVFPPAISQKIIDLLIGRPEPTLEERYNAALIKI